MKCVLESGIVAPLFSLWVFLIQIITIVLCLLRRPQKLDMIYSRSIEHSKVHCKFSRRVSLPAVTESAPVIIPETIIIKANAAQPNAGRGTTLNRWRIALF